MSEERQETVADVVDEMRQDIANGTVGIWSDFGGEIARSYADRIEAAAKREREAGAEAACHKPVTDCHGLNAAAMRKALMEASIALSSATHHHMTEDDANDCLAVIETALSVPPRNCDVGTPEEQSARFDAHCRKHMGCLTCPLREKDGGVPKHCEFAWSQMPYEEGGEK